jgi:chromosome segregation ATPase
LIKLRQIIIDNTNISDGVESLPSSIKRIFSHTNKKYNFQSIQIFNQLNPSKKTNKTANQINKNGLLSFSDLVNDKSNLITETLDDFVHFDSQLEQNQYSLESRRKSDVIKELQEEIEKYKRVLRSKEDDSKIEIERLEEQLNDSKEDLKNSERTLKKKAKEILSLKNEISSLQIEKDRQQEEITELTKKYEAGKERKHEKVKKLTEEIKGLKNEIKTLTENLNKSSNSITNLNKLNKTLSEEKEKLTITVQELENYIVNREELFTEQLKEIEKKNQPESSSGYSS